MGGSVSRGGWVASGAVLPRACSLVGKRDAVDSVGARGGKAAALGVVGVRFQFGINHPDLARSAGRQYILFFRPFNTAKGLPGGKELRINLQSLPEFAGSSHSHLLLIQD